MAARSENGQYGEHAARPLTAGEQRMARRAFGSAIALDTVTIRRAKWWWLQPAWVVMAPDGHIWFHPHNPSWRDDFSSASLWLQGLIVHELTHVWQRQQGINLVVRRGPWARYDYLPLIGRSFEEYGLEQQAEIVRDAYVKRMGGSVPGSPPLDVYDALLPFRAGEAERA
jgi:hypothetical protein